MSHAFKPFGPRQRGIAEDKERFQLFDSGEHQDIAN